MIKDRIHVEKVLKKQLPLLFAEYKNDNVEDKIFEGLAEKGFAGAKLTGLLSGAAKVEDLTNTELACVVISVFKFNRINELNPEHYFTEIELEQANNYTVPQKPKNINGIMTFKNVVKISEDHYTVPIVEWKQVVDYFNDWLIYYNVRTQRQTTKKFNSRTGEYEEKITINKKAVNEIEKEMLQGTFTPNTIALNIRNDSGMERYKFTSTLSEIIGELEIQVTDDDTKVDIVDGMHRTLAAIQILSDNPNFKGVTKLDIFHYDREKALKFIEQENKRTEIAKEHIEKNKVTTGTTVVKRLNTTGSLSNNSMFNKVAEDFVDMKSNNKNVVFLDLSNAIDNFYNEQNSNVIKLSKYLIDFLGLIIDEYKGYFDEKNNKNDHNYQKNNLFYGLISLSFSLYQQNNWEDILIELLSEIRIVDILEQIPTYHPLKSKDKKSIEAYFNALINNYIIEEVK